MARLAPRGFDIGWHSLMSEFFSDCLGVEQLPGFRSREELRELYNSVASEPIDEIDWYVAAGSLDYAAVMSQLLKLERMAGEGDNVYRR